ncbi:MAG: iron-sulfur cluster assembly scaffold protein [Candidatus Heimdallarchaeota archaeon]|jgi:nitrogen fixation NifU-like protein|nr:iron-sulfur cluster assembly scaffold protein [Candidatus Heimdallarchaeota archaeon]MBY8995043.1 iron-sulfur cluster assembly scaffold protein [Candidatus Heimdallarchaeota archaeon]
MKLPYSEKVLDHFKNPRNVGECEDPDGKSVEGSPACGDMVQLTIMVDEKTKIITDIKFMSYGCASNIATGSIITEIAKGKTLDEAKKISWKTASEELGGLPAIKAHCSVLAVSALREAIRNYEEKHGIVEKPEPTTEEVVKRRLQHVMNPLTGLDVIRTNLITNIKIEGDDKKIIEISVDLTEDHQFANNVREEIIEKLQYRNDVEEVIVIFKK